MARVPRVRAFTLLELMVAIAVVALIASIVVPMGVSRLREARADEAFQSVDAALALARATARRSGRPVSLVAGLEPDGVTTLRVRDAGDPGAGPTPPGRVPGVIELPRDVGVTAREPRPREGAGPMVVGAATGSDAASDRSPVVIVTFTPDGSAWPPEAGPAWLVGPGERARPLGVNRWTGTLRPAESPTADGDDAAPIHADGDGAAPDLPEARFTSEDPVEPGP